MAAIAFVLLAMSVLDPIWNPPAPAEPAPRVVRGWIKKIEMEETQRSRSPRRRHRGVKAMLKSWTPKTVKG